MFWVKKKIKNFRRSLFQRKREKITRLFRHARQVGSGAKRAAEAPDFTTTCPATIYCSTVGTFHELSSGNRVPKSCETDVQLIRQPETREDERVRRGKWSRNAADFHSNINT